MKKIFTPLVCLAFFASCTKNDIVVEVPEIVVTQTAMTEFSPGKTGSYFNVDISATPVSAVARGEFQSWDFSNLAVQSTVTTGFLTPAPNDSFSTATYMQEITDSFVNSASLSKYFAENSAAGLASLGKEIQQLGFKVPGAELTLPAQSIRMSKKLYTVKFPLKYKDSTSDKGIKEVYKMLVTIPPIYPTNTPGTETATTDYSISAIASGFVKLKGYPNQLPVIVVKHFSETTINYLINGQVPDPAILAAAGGEENEKQTNITYTFYSPAIGYVGSIYVNEANTVLGATFKRNF